MSEEKYDGIWFEKIENNIQKNGIVEPVFGCYFKLLQERIGEIESKGHLEEIGSASYEEDRLFEIYPLFGYSNFTIDYTESKYLPEIIKGEFVSVEGIPIERFGESYRTEYIRRRDKPIEYFDENHNIQGIDHILELNIPEMDIWLFLHREYFPCFYTLPGAIPNYFGFHPEQITKLFDATKMTETFGHIYDRLNIIDTTDTGKEDPDLMNVVVDVNGGKLKVFETDLPVEKTLEIGSQSSVYIPYLEEIVSEIFNRKL